MIFCPLNQNLNCKEYNMARKYIWLIGENLSETANNNSFYFWKQ